MASPAALSVMDSAFCQGAAGQDLASHSSVLVKDASKRKRVNRKLKQCKLDVRREQWLSQVSTGKHCKESHQESSPSGKLDLGEIIHPENHGSPAHGLRDSQHYASENFEDALSHTRLHLSPRHCEDEELKGDSSPSASVSCTSNCLEADVSPKSTSSESPKSKVIKVGTNGQRGTRERPINEMKSKNGTAGHVRPNSGPFDVSGKADEYSRDSEIEDWEAAADALGLCVSSEGATVTSLMEGRTEEVNLLQVNSFESTTQRAATSREVISWSSSGKAWRPDDVHRPSSLPNLSKQQSLSGCFSEGNQQLMGAQKAVQDLTSGPSLCPICAEELDTTDASFEPCTCGFQLCLFCHHRIASEDGRCPGCRRFYSANR